MLLQSPSQFCRTKTLRVQQQLWIRSCSSCRRIYTWNSYIVCNVPIVVQQNSTLDTYTRKHCETMPMQEAKQSKVKQPAVKSSLSSDAKVFPFRLARRSGRATATRTYSTYLRCAHDYPQSFYEYEKGMKVQCLYYTNTDDYDDDDRTINYVHQRVDCVRKIDRERKTEREGRCNKCPFHQTTPTPTPPPQSS